MTSSFARLRPCGLAALCLLQGACAAYRPLPLPARPPLAASLSALSHDGTAPETPLTLAEIARLAVENNPDLVAARAQRGVAGAQVLQAGLLRNPAVTGAILPLAAGMPFAPRPGGTLAWNAGISYDLKSLITLSARRRGAREAARQVDAQLLWQEWQVIGQARLLAADLIEGERSLRLLGNTRDLLAARDLRSRNALAAGNATLSAVAPDIAALEAAQTQLEDLARLQLARRHQLNALLNLAPDVPVPLAARADLPPLDAAAIARGLPTLASRRPDFVALRLGYRAQDARFRAAILGQFPNVTIGLTGGSDNSNIRNVGPQITLDLPVFDRNQGNVAIERATRQQLHDEYAARLAAADGQVRALLTETALLEQQLAAERGGLAAARRAAEAATRALGAAELDERSYVDLVSARYAKEQQIIAVEQALLEQQVAIATLTGAGMPSITLPPILPPDEPRS